MRHSSYDRRRFCEQLGLGALAAATPFSQAHADTRKTNIVFILADDLGWSDLGCYGSDLHETPNIDRLAKNGMRFTQAYAASPVCSPTRASIMTGKYPAKLHMTVWFEQSNHPEHDRKLIPPVTVGNMPHSEVTIAECLKAGGYRTAHIGKWHLGEATHYPQTQGFDMSIGGTHWGAPQTYWYPYRGWRNSEEFRYIPGLPFGKEGEYLTDRLTDEAMNVMDHWKDGPFFLYLAYHTVHTPIEGKKELVEYYRKKLKPGMKHQNAEYAAMVHSLDENVGRVVQKINDLGIADNTAIVFFSDNGGFLQWRNSIMVTDNSPLRSGKGSLYEGGIREPMIVHWPGVTKPGSECDRPVSSIDFYPTLLEIIGLEGDPKHNADVDGLSIASLLKDSNASWERDTLYWHYPHYYPTTTPVSAVRRGDWKLLEYFEDGHLELYNLKDDVGERHNLAVTNAAKAQELKAALHDWRKRMNAHMPTKNNAFQGET